MVKFSLHSTGEEVSSVSEILKKVDEFCRGEATGSVWLRGHADYYWKLKPTIGREHYFIGNCICFDEHKEKNLLHRFRRYAYAHLNRALGEWGALLLARHHGLPVRLLDWTSNPLMALYFATAYDKEPVDGAVWAFLRQPDDSSDIDIFTEKRTPLEIKGVRIIYPLVNSPRITAQSSAFTIQDDPRKSLDVYAGKEFSLGEMDIAKLVKWKVPKEKKANIIEELERTAINQRTIFPDLDGLAKGLWQAEAIRRQR